MSSGLGLLRRAPSSALSRRSRTQASSEISRVIIDTKKSFVGDACALLTLLQLVKGPPQNSRIRRIGTNSYVQKTHGIIKMAPKSGALSAARMPYATCSLDNP